MIAVLASAPALPLHSAGKYVAGAYIVFVVALVIYLGIMGIRLGHTQRELRELKQEVEQRADGDEAERDLEHVG
ncbi:MAG TPA: hypothetical protein VGX45_14765 [Solirubrobacteraceae bacterium]|jgi:hypothetical protein|nr:hypothetical protein [Solirubrobacteraceae bacterium]